MPEIPERAEKRLQEEANEQSKQKQAEFRSEWWMRRKALGSENQWGRVATTKVRTSLCIKCGLSENGKHERISQLMVRRGRAASYSSGNVIRRGADSGNRIS